MIIRCLIFLIVIISPKSAAAQIPMQQKDFASSAPAGSSVLSNGKWYKIKIPRSGIYRLTYEQLVQLGFSNPANISIFGNGGKMLPLINGVPRYDDLIENPIYMYKGSDGSFNQGDYILFYAEGPVTWEYDIDAGMYVQRIHSYSDATYYFLTEESGLKRKISERPPVAGTPGYDIRSFVDYSFREKNLYNFLESGRQWYGDRVDFTPFDSVFTFPGLVTSSPVKVAINVVARSSGNKVFTLHYNNSVIGTVQTGKVNLQDKTGAYAAQNKGYFSFNAGNDNVNLKLTFNKSSSTDEGYLDYLTINVRRRLSLTGDVMFFRDTTGMGSTSVARYFIENCTPQTEIWDISNLMNIVKVPATLNGNTLMFTDSVNTLREYVVLKTNASFPQPVTNNDSNTGIVPNQNLHSHGSHQMVIVTHPNFIEAADSIARFHTTHDGLSVVVATTTQIYNEFSSGAPDVSALRDYVKMIYDRASGEDDRLKYLLLLGDGSYNNISAANGNSNFILTYQSENSLHAAFSYVSDDFYGFMEDGEGGSPFMEDYSLDIGVGRLPVKTPEEAMSIYRKIRNYSKPENRGDWQNNILFGGDDQDGNLHMNQSNELANWVEKTHPEFVVKRVFLDAYPRVSTTSGARYPDVNRILKNNLEKGLLIFNYTGHGGELGLADERILMREDLTGLTNFNRLPLFITATCEFSRFDDLTRTEDGLLTESTSAGELSLLNPNGGSIALVSTTRIVYSSENHQLNGRLLQTALSRDGSGNYRRLGDIMRIAKNILGDSRNKLNFILLGDPAVKLAIPSYEIVTDSINHIPVSEPVDTLKAFSKVIISGHVEDNNGNFISTFNGIVHPSVFDKPKIITTLANDAKSFPMQFLTREDLLFRGKASIKDGRFTFEFMVPKDITYNYGSGKITYFAYNSTADAKGTFSNFVIGGSNRAIEPDNTGPRISLYLNDENFNNRGITNQNPVIYAEISDESGINTIGNGIGHDIIGIINNDMTNPVVLNDFFESKLDDPTSGLLIYPMFGLPEGTHSLKLKAWDIYNNSSEAIIEFRVISDDQIIITRIGNFPNPASDHTTFVFEHNQAGEELVATITVFDMGGRLIYSYSENIPAQGFNATTPVWDLKDMNGNALRPGIYPYRIRISNGKGTYADSYQKLVVVR